MADTMALWAIDRRLQSGRGPMVKAMAKCCSTLMNTIGLSAKDLIKVGTAGTGGRCHIAMATVATMAGDKGRGRASDHHTGETIDTTTIAEMVNRTVTGSDTVDIRLAYIALPANNMLQWTSCSITTMNYVVGFL